MNEKLPASNVSTLSARGTERLPTSSRLQATLGRGSRMVAGW